jgi:acetyl esterase
MGSTWPAGRARCGASSRFDCVPIDRHAQRFLDKLAALGPPSALALTVGERRIGLEQLLSFSGRQEPVGRVEDQAFPGPEGPVRVRIYTPAEAPATALPGLVYFHGGGLCAGSLDTHDGICRSLANASGCRVISVDYRLAPEHPFPAALADGRAAGSWVAAQALSLGVDSARLVIGGDSAGATLAAAICQMTASAGTVRWALQFLLCPIMDFRADTESRRRLARGYLLDEATLEHDLKHYLTREVDPTDPRVSPLRAVRLANLPPACIHTAEFDPLCDEGHAYAERLSRAGVKTLYRCHSGMIHLFYGMGSLIPYAAAAYQMMGADIRTMLA